MKLIDLLEADVISFTDRLNRKKEIKNDIDFDQKENNTSHQASLWFNRKVQPLLNKFFKIRVFGFNDMYQLHEFLSDSIYGFSSELDTDSYNHFVKAMKAIKEPSTLHRLKILSQSIREILAHSKQVLDEYESWKEGVPDGIKYLESEQTHQLTTWEQIARWCAYLRKFFLENS